MTVNKDDTTPITYLCGGYAVYVGASSRSLSYEEEQREEASPHPEGVNSSWYLEQAMLLILRKMYFSCCHLVWAGLFPTSDTTSGEVLY